MNPIPYFIKDSRNGQVRIRQNHLKGRQVIKVPNEIADGWNKKKGLPRDSEQAARLQNLITKLERGSKRLAAKGHPMRLYETYGTKFMRLRMKEPRRATESLTGALGGLLFQVSITKEVS